jgi:hypothetical protein
MDDKERFIDYCRAIKRPGMDKLLEWLEKTDFYTAPASSRYHGAYPGGLLRHSLHVLARLSQLVHTYQSDVEINPESVLICSLFHDLCKVNFYSVEKRNRKNEQGQWESYDAYTIDEKFRFGGHGSKSVFILQQYIKLTAEEAVAINCHMSGFGDNREYVGKAYEQFPLAWLLSVADQAATYIDENENFVRKGE